MCEYLSFILASKVLKLVLPIYEIRSLKHSYADQTVLALEHLTVQPASIVGLIGPNGSGKSTLLRLLGLIERPTEGKIFFNGLCVEPFADEARFQITLLPQEPLLMKRSVFRNVSYGLKLRGNQNNLIDRVNAALSLVGLPSENFARRPWYALSGGEAQRVALAARLALRPKVLLLDEPTAGVDAASAQLIKEASLRARQESGTTLIVASHDWEWLYEVCDEVIHLFKGRKLGTGRETVVFGPWQPREDGDCQKVLPDGQLIIVPKPSHPHACAVIDRVAIARGDKNPEVKAEQVVLSGIISRMALEHASGDVVVTILIANVPFSVCLARHRISSDGFYPGCRIWLSYDRPAVKWI